MIDDSDLTLVTIGSRMNQFKTQHIAGWTRQHSACVLAANRPIPIFRFVSRALDLRVIAFDDRNPAATRLGSVLSKERVRLKCSVLFRQTPNEAKR